jgi:hypothetical protein
MRRKNPKKNKEDRRKRNPLYWQTGGRQSFRLMPCKECRRAMRKADNVNARCKNCKKNEEPKNTTTK